MIEKSKQGINILKQLRDFAGGPLIGTLIGIFSVPVITRMISPDEFGKSALFSLMQSLFLLIILLGLDQAFVRFFNSKEYEKKVILVNSITPSFLFCFFVVLGIIIFAKPFSQWLFGQNELFLMVLLCFYLPALIINRFALLVIRMDLRGKLYSILSVLSQVVNFISLVLLLVFFERSFRAIIIAEIIAVLVNTAIAFYFTKGLWTFQKKYLDSILTKKLLRFGIPLVPAVALTWILNSFDKVGLKEWSSYDQLGLYAAAFKIVALLAVLQNIFTTVWVPIAYKWHENNESAAKFDFISMIVLGAMMVAYAGVVVLRDIILLFLGPEYRNTSLIFIYLLFVPVMYTLSETTTLGISFSQKTQFNLYVAIICAAFNIGGNFLLIPSLGARGAAISTAISYQVFFWARTLFSRKLWYKFKLNKYFINFCLMFLLILAVEFKGHKIVEIAIIFVIIFINILFVKKHWDILLKNGVSF